MARVTGRGPGGPPRFRGPRRVGAGSTRLVSRKSLWTAYYRLAGRWSEPDLVTGRVPWDGEMPTGTAAVSKTVPFQHN